MSGCTPKGGTMNSRGYFILGTKLMGIWCLFMSILSLGAAITTFAKVPKMGDDYANMMFLTTVVIRLIPVVYIFVGIYLLKNGTVIHNLAYPPSEIQSQNFDLSEKFILCLKLLGVYLIVSYFPDLLKTISSYLTYSNAPAGFNLFREKQFAYVNFLPSVAGISLGFYLLRSGQIFIRLAFNVDDNNDGDGPSK